MPRVRVRGPLQHGNALPQEAGADRCVMHVSGGRGCSRAHVRVVTWRTKTEVKTFRLRLNTHARAHAVAR